LTLLVSTASLPLNGGKYSLDPWNCFLQPARIDFHAATADIFIKTGRCPWPAASLQPGGLICSFSARDRGPPQACGQVIGWAAGE